MRKEALRKGLTAPRTDVAPCRKSQPRSSSARSEEKRQLDKKGYLLERDKCPALAQIREATNKAQRPSAVLT